MSAGDSSQASKKVSGSFSAGVVVTPGPPREVVKDEGPAAVLLTILIIVGLLILLATDLVLNGKLSPQWLDAITSDSEVGLVLTTIYIIYIELGRDRRDRAKDRPDREGEGRDRRG